MNSTLRVTAVLLVFPLTACCTGADSSQAPASRPSSRPAASPASKPDVSVAQPSLHDAFDAMLKRHVRDELVDYSAWRAGADRPALQSYLDKLAGVDVESFGRSEQLAFYINLYNATMVAAILERQSDAYSTSDDEFGVFDEKLVRLGDRRVSLNHLEHEIVRKTFKEPRIHVALVCGARSCPPLLPRAYRAKDLDEVLEANMRAFITGGTRNAIDGEKLELSKLFEWYADDFGGAAAVPDYVQRYAPAGVEVKGKPVSFLDYSWTLNRVD